MNAERRSQNVWKRINSGRVRFIPEIARVIQAAYLEGMRTGACGVVDMAIELGVTDPDALTPADRKAALLKAYSVVVNGR